MVFYETILADNMENAGAVQPSQLSDYGRRYVVFWYDVSGSSDDPGRVNDGLHT